MFNVYGVAVGVMLIVIVVLAIVGLQLDKKLKNERKKFDDLCALKRSDENLIIQLQQHLDHQREQMAGLDGRNERLYQDVIDGHKAAIVLLKRISDLRGEDVVAPEPLPEVEVAADAPTPTFDEIAGVTDIARQVPRRATNRGRKSVAS